MKVMKVFVMFMLGIWIILPGCKNDAPTEPNIPHETGSMTDIDGNEYGTVKIGDQWWMAENLKTTRTADGSVLSGVFVYNDDESYISEYGRLYTWEAAMNACPAGWHLPSDAEWEILIRTLGSEPGTKLKVGGSSGFNAKMAGFRANGEYGYLGSFGLFWTSTASSNIDHAVQKLIVSDESGVITDNIPVETALSVRCILNTQN